MDKIKIRKHVTGDSWVASFNGTTARDVDPSVAYKHLVAFRLKHGYRLPGDPP